jgi:hypothetical protein
MLQVVDDEVVSAFDNNLYRRVIIKKIMQYFMALKIGEKRVKSSQELLSRYTGHAMPALALKDNKSNKWEPVGEENLLAIVNESNGFMIALCDENGIAKSIAQWFTEDVKNNIVERIIREHGLDEYSGKLSLPV